MKIIRTEKQKENLAKLFWDLGKIVFAVIVLAPLAKPELLPIEKTIWGLAASLIFWSAGYILDGKEI